MVSYFVVYSSEDYFERPPEPSVDERTGYKGGTAAQVGDIQPKVDTLAKVEGQRCSSRFPLVVEAAKRSDFGTTT